MANLSQSIPNLSNPIPRHSQKFRPYFPNPLLLPKSLAKCLAYESKTLRSDLRFYRLLRLGLSVHLVSYTLVPYLILSYLVPYPCYGHIILKPSIANKPATPIVKYLQSKAFKQSNHRAMPNITWNSHCFGPMSIFME